MTARRRRARGKLIRSRASRAKALRRRARGGGAASTAGAAAVAAVSLAGGSLVAGISPATAAVHNGPAASVQSAVGSGGLARATCDPHTPSSNPSEAAEVGGTVFFTADDGVRGPELWKSDGTPAGTVLVKDITTGSGDSYDDDGPEALTGVGGTLFFTADDGVHGRELWKSDGTKAGTVMVKDIKSGSGGSYYDNGPSDLTAVGGTLFFSADDGVHGRELWKSDGTKAGTVMVKDILSGPGGYYDDGVESLTAMGTTLFFTADDGVNGQELWSSDGTAAGTAMVKDIHPGDYPSDARELTAVGTGANATLFFTARDGVHGRELWKSDGTEGGTTLVKDIHTGIGSSYDAPSFLTGVNGTLFFSADDGVNGQELWTSDGTEGGTVMVKDIHAGAGESYYDGPALLTAVGPTLFFSEDDGVHGRELWSSDGTEAGTVQVKDLNPGDYPGDPRSLTDVNGTLFFAARDGVHGRELWKSDGTEAGTVLVKDIHPGAGSPYDESSPLTTVGDTLFFAANDGVRGQELWKSDGTEAGTGLVQDVNRGGAFRVVSGRADTRKGTVTVRVLTAGGGTLVARPVGGSELRKSVRVVAESSATTITLKPTRAGMRILKREGSLRVRARFTFTPCGGTGSSVVRPFTLKLR